MVEEQKERPMIMGIDLGTTWTCTGFYNENTKSVEIFQNDLGKRTTPSVVTYEQGQTLIGKAALDRAWAGASNTITDAKRFIGLKYSSNEIK